MSRVSRKSNTFTEFGQNRHKDDEAKIQIQKKCISCSDAPGHVVQLFKLACLTYFPGKVWYQNQSLSRYELINQLNVKSAQLQEHLEETKRKSEYTQQLMKKEKDGEAPPDTKIDLPPNILEEIQNDIETQMNSDARQEHETAAGNPPLIQSNTHISQSRNSREATSRPMSGVSRVRIADQIHHINSEGYLLQGLDQRGLIESRGDEEGAARTG